MALNIPTRLNDALITLFLLSSDSKEKVLEIFTKTAPTIGIPYYEKKLKEVEGIPRRVVREIVRFLLGAYNVAETEHNVSGIAEAVTNSLRELEDERLTKIEEGEYENFKEFLLAILTTNHLRNKYTIRIK